MSNPYDLLIIGGGINGAGIARDAAGRGAKVLLVEKDDLAQHTSSASTKLIHGGLRYLEHYEFRLVREALIERERLLQIAPHIVWPLRFVLPHDEGLRPKWILRLGLFLYDHLGGRKILPPTRTIDLHAPPHGDVLKDRLVSGFEYSDCWVEDSRLVVLNAVGAAERGADVRTRTECTALERGGEVWTATVRSSDGEEQTVQAKVVINSAGPWVDAVLGLAQPGRNHANLRLVKGSHLIFPKLFDHDICYIFQNKDNRIVFAIPYEREFTLVGTTDVAFTGDPDTIAISDEESRYICDAVNEYLRVDVSPGQAVSSYSGVRPLYEDQAADNSTVTRDYVFELDNEGGGPPILSIFGGKITTYRKLAEHALEKLEISGASWTAEKPLPGGEIAVGGFEAFVVRMMDRYPFLPQSTVVRLCRAYGSLVAEVLGEAASTQALGEEVAPGLFEAELHYLVEREFARTAEDVLWRRSKLGLHLDSEAQNRVAAWFARREVEPA
ncbi:glycerol-3-phosphate dehydrogenase [Erythrobacter litoralis]|uniref:Glycerol-3-phosphate dehydrogenase n=1 Tax=Erythrobacter litoralis (strain HTCC2594) TaxID=314225 RepID=Q2NBZ7_ERYLH|nr:glycerol-3-phosphate dehydrogenase [Erythrobacter litoralis]ABC62794.1 glycerol-3-phosphate dehydrogenase [Erythrobacter litoralis HTCC2594]